jgi:bacteriorhodopsin
MTRRTISMLQPPWTATLTQSEHDLMLFGLVAAALGLLATLVRGRFTSGESHGTFRAASLTANAVVAIAFASYLAIIAAFLLGYTEHAGLYRPNGGARLSWELRYMDWFVTVPLLVLELIAISALTAATADRLRRIGMVSAAAMILCGFLGAFIVAGGADPTSYVLLGVGGALFFGVLYGLFVYAMRVSLPRLPVIARGPYRSAAVVLLISWLVYPIVYGVVGAFTGGVVATIAQLALIAADMVAKIGFGTLVHRTSVLRSRNEESLDPSTVKRPRIALNDSVYVADSRAIDFDTD